MTQDSRKLISIITPVFNEEDNIIPFYSRMTGVVDSMADYDFEFVFTDNASTDRTFEMLEGLALKDRRVRVFRFSRNFGYQPSIFTGYSMSRGEAAIEYDCDLQDPPELLPEFIEKWEQGYRIVYGERRSRREGRIIQYARKLFYRLINMISDSDLPHDAGDFMLMDRVVVDQLRKSEERSLYIRGMVFSYGYSRAAVPYSREARKKGTSKFPLRKMLQMAVDGIASQSVMPLRIASYVALTITSVTIALSVFYLVLKFYPGYEVPAGFTTTTLLILLSICLNAFFLGIVGEYLARIYQQVRKKPVTIIEKRIEGGSP
jgi:dolichol-phosphate mannosyltransferase